MAKRTVLPTISDLIKAVIGIVLGLYFYSPVIVALHQSNATGELVVPSWFTGMLSTFGNYSPEVAGLILSAFALGAISLFTKVKTILVYFFVTVAVISILSLMGVNIPDFHQIISDLIGNA